MMEKQLERKMEAHIAKLRAELSVVSGNGPEVAGLALPGAIQSVVARLTESPTNFHQATVFYLATDALADTTMAA
eukprot:COSAG04_NODE_29001_length_272_cov_0.589595_1_plen_74_part_10